MQDPTDPNDQDGACPGAGGDGGAGGCAGQPINVANGDTYITQQDYSIPGLAGGLTLTRTWNSLWPSMNNGQPPEESGIFGDSWRSTFEERIQVQSLNLVAYWKANGSRVTYNDSGAGPWPSIYPATDFSLLNYNTSTTQWTVTTKNGTVRTFNSLGYLISITDRNNNTISVNIDSNHQNRIASVTDAANRTLNFNYANASFPRLCTSISDAAGTFTQYRYDTSGNLIQVSYPDGSVVHPSKLDTRGHV